MEVYSPKAGTVYSQSQLKILGFHFGAQPNVNNQIEYITNKARRRFWVLRHLKAAGLTQDDLLLMYKCFVLSLSLIHI